MFDHQLIIIGILVCIVLPVIIMTGADEILGGFLLPIVLAIAVLLLVDMIVTYFIPIKTVAYIVNIGMVFIFWFFYPKMKRRIKEILHTDDLTEIK